MPSYRNQYQTTTVPLRAQRAQYPERGGQEAGEQRDRLNLIFIFTGYFYQAISCYLNRKKL